MALMPDLRYAARTLLRERATSGVIVMTLTMAIAANAIMVGVVDQLLLQAPPGIGSADAVRRLYFGAEPQAAGRIVRPAPNQSYPLLTALPAGLPALSATATTHIADVTLGSGPDARLAAVELVSAGYFPLLELVPVAGRFFTPTEDRAPDADPVVVLSYPFWVREFNGDPGVVGGTLLIEGRRLTVIGVAPQGFSGTRRRRIDLWAPPGALGRELLGADWATRDNVYRFELLARLAPGATDAQANAQITTAYRRISGNDDVIAFGAPLTGLGNPTGITGVAKVGLCLLGVAAVVLLIACANSANLLLARTIGRSREIATRVAIGASRGRLLRQLATESALLSAIAAAGALLVTYVGGRLVQQLLLPGYAWNDGVVDERVLAVTLGVATLTTFVAGLAPALYTLSDDVMTTLRPAPRVTRGRTGTLRTGLLTMQVTLCVVLLIGAGLFVKSLAAVRAKDVGLDLERVIQATLPATGPATAARELYAEAMARLSAIPGVRSVALSGGSTRLRSGRSTSMTPEGMTMEDVKDRDMDAYFVVTPGYFSTIGARIERGRDLTEDDDRTRARVAVISRAFADRFWPDVDPVGRCVSFSIVFDRASCTTIVGVVQSLVLHNRTTTDSAQIYVLQSHPRFARDAPTALLIRAEADARALVPVIRNALQTLRPDIGYVDAATLEAMFAPQLQPWRLGSSMFMAFGAIALLIAAVGLYSTMAFAVSQRTQEIGIRMALGASRWDITASVGASGAVTMAAGICLGLLGAALASRWLTDLLFETSPRDPLVFAAVAAALALTGIVAGIVPARRATRVDPLIALRTE